MLSQRIKSAEMESWCLGMLKECLVFSFMRLGVSFIVPRQLGSVESNPERQILPSVEWCTGQSSEPPDTVRCIFLSCSGAADHWKNWSRWRTGHCSVHTEQSGAPIRPLARPRVTRGLRRRPLARPTVGSPDSPMIFSRTPPSSSRERPVD